MTTPYGPLGGSHRGGSTPVSQAELQGALQGLWEYILGMEEVLTRMGEKMANTQADVDALTKSVSDDVAKIQAEIAALQSANPALDLSGLQNAVASLDATANGGGSAPAPAGS